MSETPSTFIADRQVTGVRETGKSTPGGDPILEVAFSEGNSSFIPKKRYEKTKTSSASDATTARNTLVTVVAGQTYAMLHEYGVQVKEVNAILDGVAALVQAGKDRATNILWGIEHSDDQDMNQVNAILMTKENAKSNSANYGSTPEGSVAVNKD